MRIVLLQDIKNVGKRGDIKEISDGYARNFLLPKKLAEMATETAIKNATVIKNKEQENTRNEFKKIQDLVKIINQKKIIISTKEKEEKLFGSVTTKNIVAELKKENIELPEKFIILEKPIKKIGEYKIKIAFGHGLKASLELVVKKEK